MHPAQSRAGSGTSRLTTPPAILSVEDMNVIFDSELLHPHDPAFRLMSDDLREGETKRGIYFPRPAMKLVELTDLLQPPEPVPHAVLPESLRSETWAMAESQAGWCRVDMVKHDHNGLDPKSLAQLGQTGFRIPNALETVILYAILARIRHPIAQDLLKSVTTDVMLDRRFGRPPRAHVGVILHQHRITFRAVTDRQLGEYPVFHAKLG